MSYQCCMSVLFKDNLQVQKNERWQEFMTPRTLFEDTRKEKMKVMASFVHLSISIHSHSQSSKFFACKYPFEISVYVKEILLSFIEIVFSFGCNCLVTVMIGWPVQGSHCYASCNSQPLFSKKDLNHPRWFHHDTKQKMSCSLFWWLSIPHFSEKPSSWCDCTIV